MKFKIEKSSIIHKGFLSITRAEVKYDSFNGALITATREMMDRGDSVAILLYEEDTDSVLLTNQFRYPAAEKDRADNFIDAGWLLELPAGGIAENEDPAEAGKREVEEELGYSIQKIEPISCFYVSPGGTSERIWLYYAKVEQIHKTQKGGGLKYEKEDIELHKLPAKEIITGIADGRIRDAKTIIALQWFLMKLSH
jgi:nudix-type nucleoside diphosphatase (YffH/AdpP family)